MVNCNYYYIRIEHRIIIYAIEHDLCIQYVYNDSIETKYNIQSEEKENECYLFSCVILYAEYGLLFINKCVFLICNWINKKKT